MSTEGGWASSASSAADTGRDYSFAELFARYYESALTLAALLEADQTRAEDAVCNAFARVYGRLRRGGVDEVGPYLRQAVVNAVRDGWRRRHVERRYANAFMTDMTAEAFQSNVVERDEVRHALRRLPPGQRRVVELRYYEDLSEADVARFLHVKLGTVKSQAAKGLAARHSILEVRDG